MRRSGEVGGCDAAKAITLESAVEAGLVAGQGKVGSCWLAF